MSLVIVAYRDPVGLARLLGCVSSPQVERVVVVVEHDPEVERVARESGATVVPLQGNPGYAAGVNCGVQHVSCPVVVFANDDIVTSPEVLLGLATTIEAGVADVVIPGVLDGGGRPVRTVQAVPSLSSLLVENLLLPDRPVRVLDRILSVQKWREPTGREVVRAASAIAVAVRADLLRSVPLPEHYFLYWEESEWFARLDRRGVRILYDPGLTVRHSGGRAVVNPMKNRLLARNAVRCIRHLYGPGKARLAYVLVVLWQLRLVLTGLIRFAARGRDASAPLFAARVAGLRSALSSWPETR